VTTSVSLAIVNKAGFSFDVLLIYQNRVVFQHLLDLVLLNPVCTYLVQILVVPVEHHSFYCICNA
jgi:hypothetical protein